jgi:acyl-CoA hydrolase
MEVGVRVESENPLLEIKRHTGSAYITYVALSENNRPAKLPPLILATEEDKKRNTEAERRRQIRLAERRKEKICL